MSTTIRSKENVDCAGGICGLEHCTKHKVAIHYAHTSDTVSVYVDDTIYATFGDNEWEAIVQVDYDYTVECIKRDPRLNDNLESFKVHLDYAVAHQQKLVNVPVVYANAVYLENKAVNKELMNAMAKIIEYQKEIARMKDAALEVKSHKEERS